MSGRRIVKVRRGSGKRSGKYAGSIRNVLGTQQPVMKVRTGFTTLSTTGTPNLVQVVGMDVSGITQWASLANLFDEYRVRRADLKITPQYVGYGASASTLSAMPVICVVDYDDGTALTALSNAIQYDSAKILYMGSSKPSTHIVTALPEGQPDLAWVTTATPTIPFWFKFWSISTLIPTSGTIGYCYIELEIEFRQLG